MKKDTSNNKKERIKTIARFMKPYTFLFIVAEVCILVLYTVSVLLPLNLTRLIDDVFYAENYMLLKEVILMYLLLFAVRGITNLVYSYTWQTLNNRYVVDVKTSIYKTIMYSKADKLVNMNSGDIMSRIDNDADQFIYIVQRNIFHFINSVLMCVGIIIIVARINLIIAIMLIVTAVLPIILTKFLGKFVEKYTRNLREINGVFTGKLFEIIKGFGEIILFRAQRWTHKVLFTKLKESILLENKTKKMDFIANKTIYFINLTTSIMIYSFSAWLIYQGYLTVGFFLALIEYVALLHKKINWILRIYLDWHGRKVSVDRISEVLNNETEMVENENKMPIGVIESIVFQNVSFAYKKETGELGKNVFENISFEINKGEKVAISGVSGIGKTTVTGLILKYFQPTEGKVLINGKNIVGINSFDLRKNIGIVQQEVVLFSESIRYNLIQGIESEKNDEELLAVCEKVGLLDLIRCLPKGLDTKINAVSDLSGGQKQRKMIARILLKGVTTIILDEATSALDEETENNILNKFEEYSAEITMIVISHRESTIKKCERKIELVAG